MFFVIEDTRNKETKHENIGIYLSNIGIPIKRKKLLVGDYMRSDDDSISIDTKSGMPEICMDLGVENSRFRREMIRANEMGIKLIVLIEDGRFQSISDVVKWKNPNYNKSKLYMSGQELAKRMRTAQISYGVEFRFCRKCDTGKTLIQILSKHKNEVEING